MRQTKNVSINFIQGSDDILFDYSKNIITDKTLGLLLQLAEESKVKDAIAAMFNGDMINETENRSVLHIALRNFSKEPVYAQGNNVMPEVKKVLRKMKSFCDAVHKGDHRGYTGKRIKYIVNIGIGGSDLGPRPCCHPLPGAFRKDLRAVEVSATIASRPEQRLPVRGDRTNGPQLEEHRRSENQLRRGRLWPDWFSP